MLFYSCYSCIYSVHYRNNEYADQTSDDKVNKKYQLNTSSPQCDQESAAVKLKESTSSYQPLTTDTLKRDGIYTNIRVGKRSRIKSPLPSTQDEVVYDTCP